MTEKRENVVGLVVKFLILLGVFLIVANSVLIMMLFGVVMRVDEYNKGIVDEVGGILGDVVVFGDDLNEMRRFLMMPEKKYNFEENEDDDELNDGEASMAVEIYGLLAKEIELERSMEVLKKTREMVKNWSEDSVKIKELAGIGFKLNKSEEIEEGRIEMSFLGEKGMLVSVLFDAKKDVLISRTVLGEKEIGAFMQNDLWKDFLTFLNSEKDKILLRTESSIKDKMELEKYLKDERIKNLLTERFLTLEFGTENLTEFSFFIKDISKKPLTEIKYQKSDGNIKSGESVWVNLEDFKNGFEEYLSAADFRTELEKEAQKRLEEFELILKENAFSESLKLAGIKLENKKSENGNAVHEFRKQDSETLLFVLLIETSSGRLKIVKGGKEFFLDEYLRDVGSKKKPW